jgi:hypothetical protein
MDYPTTKNELLATMAARRAEWDALLDRVGNDRMEAPGVEGYWTVKDVVAHICAFEQYAAALLVDQKSGAGDQTAALDAYYRQHLVMYRMKHPDFPEDLQSVKGDQINELFTASFRYKTPAEVRAMEASAFQSMVAGLEPYTDAELNAPFAGRTLIQVLANQCYGHYATHMPVIEKWLEKQTA